MCWEPQLTDINKGGKISRTPAHNTFPPDSPDSAATRMLGNFKAMRRRLQKRWLQRTTLVNLPVPRHRIQLVLELVLEPSQDQQSYPEAVLEPLLELLLELL